MKHITFPVVFALLASVCFAGVVSSLTKTKATWDFIQETGGIEIVSRETESDLSVLNLRYDVSGLTHVTRDPQKANSGIVVKEVKAWLDDHGIHIEVFTSVPGKDSKGGILHKVNLPDIEDGAYPVFYGPTNDPEKLIGVISI